MYDVRGKSVGPKDKDRGRMQQAVDEWEKSAKTAVSRQEDNDDFDTEVKDIIKSRINKISEVKSQTAEATEEIPGAALEAAEEPLVENDGYENAQIADGAKQVPQQTPKKVKPVIPLEKPEPKEPEITEPLDYESEEQAHEILSEQRRLCFSLKLKFAGSFVCTLALVFLALIPVLNLSLPAVVSINVHPSYYLAANLALLFLTGIIGFSVAFKGISNMFTGTPDADSLSSLAFYAALLGGGFNLYSFVACPAPFANLPATAVFSACAAAGISLNLFAKVFYVSRVIGNFLFVADTENSKSGFFAAEPLPQSKAQNILRTFDGDPVIAVPQKVRFMTNFLEQSYVHTPADNAAKIFAPVTFVAATLAAAGEYFFKNDPAGAVTVFTAVCCVCSPLLFEFGVAVPLYRACRRLLNENAFVAGCGTISDFGGTDAAVADGSLLFPGETTRIYSVKTFSGYDIDNAVLYATSIASTAKSPLTGALMGIFADAGRGKKLLKTVDRLTYEDEKGICGIIDEKVVLLGNRGLLRHHLVESPSRDFELRYTSNGKDITYLAIDGKICAMFVIDYDMDDDSADAVHKLRHYKIRLVVCSNDPNITPQLIEERSDVSADNTVMLGAREMQALEGEKATGKCKAGLAFQNFSGYASALVACLKLKGSLRANTALQLVLSVAGFFLVIYCVYFGGGAANLLPVYLLAYQFICAAPVLLISLFRRC